MFDSTMPPKESSCSLAGIADSTGSSNAWCKSAKRARSTLNKKLHVNVPCKTMKPAHSAVVEYTAARVSKEKASKTVFSGKDYIDGVMALGASLNDHLTTQRTHKLLFLREDFIATLPKGVLEKLNKIGWTIGIAPVVDIDDKYAP